MLKPVGKTIHLGYYIDTIYKSTSIPLAPSISSYGEPWCEPIGQPYLFSGKERQHEHCLFDYHFGARQYNAATMFWSSPDSKQEDYTPLSPLSYCAANPIRFIDPTGEDLYQYNNQTGKLNFIKNDDVRDYVQIVDNKGDVILKNLIPLERSYAKGVLSYQHSPKYDKDKRCSIVKIRGDENGLEIFKFLSDNITLYSEIEFSLVQTGISGMHCFH